MCCNVTYVSFFLRLTMRILKREFQRRIRDKEILWLCEQILKSGENVLSGEYEMAWFPNDNLFAADRKRGLPIGNLTSQFWANVYLNDFDHFVKRELKCPAYVRYVDDFLLFSNEKEVLKDWRKRIIEKLETLRLRLHEEKAQIYPTEAGIPFLGFRVYPEFRWVKQRKVIQFRRKLKRLLEEYRNDNLPFSKLDASIRGWINYVRYADTWGLRRSVLGEFQL